MGKIWPSFEKTQNTEKNKKQMRNKTEQNIILWILNPSKTDKLTCNTIFQVVVEMRFMFEAAGTAEKE